MKTSRINSSDRPGQIPVTWKDCVWFSPVVNIARRSRHSNKRARCRVQFFPDPTVCGARSFNEPFMKTNKKDSRRFSGFTLIELLVVIAIIAILAAMLLPAITTARTNVLKRKAKLDMSQIAMAIKSYESTYNGRFPVPPGINLGAGDYTFGGGTTLSSIGTSVIAVTTNAGVIAIIMDEVTYGNGLPTPNKDHVLNLQKNAWLNAKKVSDTQSPGVGTDGEYRDPWGNPYIISMDLSTDERCRDAFYSLTSVSLKAGQTGHRGLSNPTGAPNSFENPGQLMIWSKGPDGQASAAVRADQGVNRDNILSWQE